MLEPSCVLCQVYHPKADKHAPDRNWTCERGRRRLRSDLESIRSMFVRIREEEAEVIGTRYTMDGAPRDPLAVLMPMANTPGRSKNPSVSGSKEKQVPINVNVIDLTAPANPQRPVDYMDPDQIGHVGVADALYEWAASWQNMLTQGQGQLKPPLEAVKLIEWMNPRLEMVWDLDRGIWQFANMLLSIKSALRGALDENDPRPIVMWGVACRRCNSMSTLVLDPEDPDRYRECSLEGCRLLMTEEEYKAWLVELVEMLREEREALAPRG